MNDKLKDIAPSPTIQFAEFVRAFEAQGNDVVKLQTGEPGFAVLDEIKASMSKSIFNEELDYCNSQGILSLREKISKKLREKNKIQVSSIEEILVTAGAVQGLALSLRGLLSAGDEVVVFEPYWKPYEVNSILCGANVKKIKSKQNFRPDLEQLEQTVSSKTRLIILNSPNNPSGYVLEKSEIQKIIKIARRNGAYILSDEVYEDFTFSGHKHISVASCSNSYDKVISLFSFSKTYAMTGFRIGYVHASLNVIEKVKKISQHTITCVPPFVQRAAECALTLRESPYLSKLIENRDFIVNKTKMSKLKIFLPEGAMYFVLDISDFGDSICVAKKLVKSGVALAPGIAFGGSWNKYLRVCYAVELDVLKRGMSVIEDVLTENGKN